MRIRNVNKMINIKQYTKIGLLFDLIGYYTAKGSDLHTSSQHMTAYFSSIMGSQAEMFGDVVDEFDRRILITDTSTENIAFIILKEINDIHKGHDIINPVIASKFRNAKKALYSFIPETTKYDRPFDNIVNEFINEVLTINE